MIETLDQARPRSSPEKHSVGHDGISPAAATSPA